MPPPVKPTILIKDDRTDFSFDTSIIEHLGYPRDLRFTKIVDFKELLKKKIEGTYRKSSEDPKYSTFLKNFGQYKVAHLQETEVSSNEFILSSLSEIKADISKMKTASVSSNDLSSLSEIRKMVALKEKKERDSLVESLMLKFAASKNIKDISTLDKHLEELMPYLVNHDSIKTMFPNYIDLRAKVTDLIHPF